MKQERGSEFVAYLSEVFRSFGEVRSRRMFGGYGIYHGGLMIGLVADGVLYLKVDSETVPAFSKAGSVQFEYSKNGKSMNMSYFSAPVEIFDESEQAKAWVAMAYGAAQRSRRRSAARKR